MIFTLNMPSPAYRCKVENILTKVDDQHSAEREEDGAIKHNEIARIRLKASRPLYFDRYRDNRENGSFILIDQINNNVRGAGIILKRATS